MASSDENKPAYTITALGRWSIIDKQLPPVDTIKTIHVYDFDNTLFRTPLPNPSLWHGASIGILSSADVILNGGWWHDPRILSATGSGLTAEEPRAWVGWWNDTIVELVRLSIKQKDALCVLLTGRAEPAFRDLIRRMISSKDLDFDMICLKPPAGPNGESFVSTMHFKKTFLEALMETYKNATEIRIYEDRPGHVKGFKDFLSEYNRRNNGTEALPTARSPIAGDVVHVTETSSHLDPVIEVAEVQHIVNIHNAALGAGKPRLVLKKTVYFTGYLLSPADTAAILKLAPLPASFADQDLKFHANGIMICPRPCPQSILDKVGGIGSRMRWEVTGTGCIDGLIWAARVRPMPSSQRYHTDNPSPLIVLALKKGARPMDASKISNWVSLGPGISHAFETTVGEKMALRLASEDPREGKYESLFANKAAKRRHPVDDDHYDQDSWRYRDQRDAYGNRNFHGYSGHSGHSGHHDSQGNHHNQSQDLRHNFRGGAPLSGPSGGGRGGGGNNRGGSFRVHNSRGRGGPRGRGRGGGGGGSSYSSSYGGNHGGGGGGGDSGPNHPSSMLREPGTYKPHTTADRTDTAGLSAGAPTRPTRPAGGNEDRPMGRPGHAHGIMDVNRYY